MEHNGKFLIRVYGLIVNAKNEVFISDEYQMDTKMTKFPGGGLEFGEGPIDCLIREIKEECNGQELERIKHFYTTDFYQKALFFENAQLISIYYLADFKAPFVFDVSEEPFSFGEMKNGNQSFRWKRIKDLEDGELTFPIDNFVAKKLKERFL